MCIIAIDANTPSKDLRVRNTKIFVMPNKDRTRQLTVYQNTVACDVKSVMILPIPWPDTFHVESQCPTGVFEQLQNSVRHPDGAHTRVMPTFTRSRSDCNEPLPKFSMPGGYVASLAPTLDDIQRVDSTTFVIPRDLLVFLELHYSHAEYPVGFLVCKLSDEHTTEVEYTPICYSHQIISEDKLLVPTLHYHGHDNEDVHWDHYIYSTQTDINANTPGFIPRDINAVLWKGFPLEFQYERLAKIHCARIVGPTLQNFNKDVLFTVPFTRVANEWTALAF
jgi:hypothetical protein